MDETVRDLRLTIGRISRRLRQLYAARSGEDDVTFMELAVLSRLERHGPMTPGALAADERVTAQAIAPVVTSLEQRALITRSPDPDDGRRVIAALTGAGRRLLESREQSIMSQFARSMDRVLDDRERRQVLAVVPLLERLADDL
ncbi:MarR family transcriptional regulator [Actinomadura sp. DC4]|uniref:MarR family winged helix-turn-helix transcriptional regulator n=1 Tax=Actinomadura sp. DC4 TaxID=3055069 RepID=UPI0025B0D044|nr:MarR family transcriptional regulator [Actinomadura sp. DC4]MDN3359567.1 MarR family transcriptional regulator [Actinomadura sp. DC4]